ncbi:pyroglutamyl-peptidase I [Jeotgalibacillus proteolyticus]|uniref:Pyroglutamyl-peptidase I n=1 Tax=Jeotgalibacillus proteolyticus TaxID=2082395 RepID=A0A2S5GCB1_9BACL|nr:pyroglutamyl-peptidase I [Jeotgalibacillus proteolyticus]PPA70588.1 peptidase C15 [Jeotgalibacillus proteolyticus]
MKKLLLTGFEPFLTFSSNPTMKIVEELGGKEINGYSIIGRIMKVDFTKSGKQIIQFYEEVQPDAVISLGLAGGRTAVTPERIAINCNDGEADNSGNIPSGEKILEEGPDGLFSTLPIKQMTERLKKEGYPAGISNTAGTYLCNHVMYKMLFRLKEEGRTIPSGFIHIPASHELAIDSGKIPSWSQQDLTNAIRLCIEELS